MFKDKKQCKIMSPLSGEAVAINQVPDAVFSEQILGDGVAIKPSDGLVVAPCDGTIAQIAHTFHAIGIESDDGLEILVHLGINTVELGGQGFQCFVKVGQKVKAGDKLMKMDLTFIKEKGYQVISPCIITNLQALKFLQMQIGQVVGGQTAIFTYKKRKR